MTYAAAYPIAAGSTAPVNAAPGQGDIANLDYGRVGWSAVVVNNSSNTIRVDTGGGSRWLAPWVTDLFTSAAGGAAQLTMTPQGTVAAGTILVTFYAANEPVPPGTYPTFGVQGLAASIANSTVVTSGPNAAASDTNPVGKPSTRYALVSAPDSQHRIVVYAFTFTITPAAGTANFWELQAAVTADGSSYVVLAHPAWNAGGQPFTGGIYLGGFEVTPGCPLYVAIGAGGLNDFNVSVAYRVAHI